MKKYIERGAFGLVALLSIGIIVLIFQYETVDSSHGANEILEELNKTKNKSNKSTNYLDTLQNYQEVDINISSTEDSSVNIEVVAEEEKDSDDSVEKAIEFAIDSKEINQTESSSTNEYSNGVIVNKLDAIVDDAL